MGLWAVILVTSGCSRGPTYTPSPAAPSEATVLLSINLDEYRYLDRDGDFQADDPKPAEDAAALHRWIAAENPDILCVRELGTAMVFGQFRKALEDAGCVFPHVQYTDAAVEGRNLAILSKLPFRSATIYTNWTYRIQGQVYSTTRPVMDVEVDIGTEQPLRLIHAHIRSNRPHPTGDVYEMRRNEARMLTQLIRRHLRESPEIPVALCGTLNTEPDAPLFADLLEDGDPPLMVDLRPVDDRGDAWTEFQPAADRYLRTDYWLASPAIIPSAKTTVLDPAGNRGGRYRGLRLELGHDEKNSS